MTARCDCCDLPVESCGRAAAQQQEAERRAVRQRLLQRPGVVAARHASACATCGGRYGLGTPIVHTEDGWTSVECCPEVLDG
jgi:hypothetical protein